MTNEVIIDIEQDEMLITSVDDNLDTELKSVGDDFTLPEKFKDKSTSDVAKSYVELEKEHGRKVNEIGELRRLNDQLLNLELNRTPGTKDVVVDTEVSSDDFFENPIDSVNSTVENNPVIKKLEARLEQSRVSDFQRRIESEHPKYTEYVSDDGFQKWIQASPIRSQLYKSADEYDYESANEIFSSWEERSKLIAATQNISEGKEKNSQALKEASSESSSTGASPTKFYRSSDIIRLRLENPSKYKAMQSEFTKAYLEGRVKRD